MPPVSENLFDLFASRFPADRAALFLDNDDGRRFSYGDLDAISARYANLLASLGVRPGDRVAVQVEKSPETVFLYLATLRMGGVYLPLNTAYQRNELAYFLEDAEPALFVCDPAREAQLRELAQSSHVPHLLTLDADGGGSLTAAAAGLPASFATHPGKGGDLAAILYTSGTTGRSKGAMLTHGNLAANARALHQVWGWRPDDVLLHALPVFHVHGLFVATNCVLLNGTGMIFQRKFDAAQVLAALPRATVMMGVPTFYTRLLDQPGLSREATAHMRLFISGSAPLLADTHRQFSERTGHAILERYGMTETGIITSHSLDRPRLPGTVGFPLPGVSVRIAGEDGTLCPTGEVGVLETSGPNVFQGYWKKPEKTAEDMRPDGYFITGDVAFIDADGYVHLVGRAKDMIISGGFNVYPIEIEAVIDALPGVAESAVIGAPHPDFGEAVVAVVQKSADGDPTEADIIVHVKTELANFKVPKRVLFLDALPRNQMGKVQKALLRSDCARLFQDGQ